MKRENLNAIHIPVVLDHIVDVKMMFVMMMVIEIAMNYQDYEEQ
uniref:Uncharacterized protein n=1 Tax=Rhizophora mucronata TaxID=61149 RepID=A0A2P2NU99_RHIMU